MFSWSSRLFRDRKKSRYRINLSMWKVMAMTMITMLTNVFSYNSNLAYLLARKCQGKEIEGDGAVQRLVELRTVIEKIRQQDPRSSKPVFRILMFLGLLDSDPWIRILFVRNLLSTSKNWRKTLISTVLWILYDFLSLKNDVNVPSKRNKHKNLL